MAIITIRGTSLPCPIRGLKVVVSTNVNSGRNALGEMVGEKVGRDIYKLDAVEWRWLTRRQWSEILRLVDGDHFKFKCTFPDVVNEGRWVTHLCYCGDRSCEPYYINSSGDFTFYRSCTMNIIDCGLLEEHFDD